MTILSLIINVVKLTKEMHHFFYNILVILIDFAILYKTQYVFSGIVYMLHQMDGRGLKRIQSY